MRASLVKTVFLKEARETLRDRRTLTMMIGLPLLLYPLLILGMTAMQTSQREASDARPSTVAVWGNAPPELLAGLAGKSVTVKANEGAGEAFRGELASGRHAPLPPPDPNAKRERNAPPPPDHPAAAAARPLILGRTVDAVLVLWPDVASSVGQGGVGHAAVLYDSVRRDSSKAHDRVQEALASYREELLARRERERGLQPGFSQGLAVGSRNVASLERRAGFGLGQMLPFLLIAVSFSAAFYTAIDVSAGEKERGTMQTLLCAPLLPTEIIAGKFLAVWAVALTATLANLASMALTFLRLSTEAGIPTLSPSAYGMAFLLLLPVTLTVSAVFLAVGVFAKDFKDGQNYLTPVLMALMLPSGAAMVPGLELSLGTMFVPIMNISLLIKAMLIGEARPDTVFLVLLASAMYATLAVLFAARVFERESVLLGGKDTWRGLFGMERRPGEPARPTPSLALTLFAAVLVVAFYGSAALRDRGLVTMLLTLQYGFFLLPVLAVVAAFRFPVRPTLSLRVPGWRGVTAGLLLGVAGWTVAASIAYRLLPPPDSLSKAMERVLRLENDHPPLWAVWLVVAITPAICEELLFRGLILSGLRRLGMWPAIALSSLLFAVAHASVYRLLPTLVLGLLFGYAAWRTRSVVPGMVAHALNNGLIATVALTPEWAKALNPEQVRVLPWTWTAAGAVVVMAALWLLRREGAEEETGGTAEEAGVLARAV